MHRLITTALTAAVALLLSAAIASARTGIQLSQVNTTATFSNLTVSTGLGVDISCDVTMRITLHESIPKVVGALVIHVVIIFGTCSEGEAGLLVGRRRVTEYGTYHGVYLGFTGTLPNIEEIIVLLQGVEFWVSNSGVECLTEGPQSISIATTGGNPATGLAITGQNIALDGDFPCDFSSGTLNGSGSLSTELTLRLI